jgi:hypothetical protein
MQPTGEVCRNCGNNFTGKYCNNCGEKIYHEQDKSVWHLLGEAFHFTTHFEGTFFNTFKAIITTPGKLSLDYCSGIRKKYFKPISFFLLLVIIYLLFPVFEGLNQKLYYYTHDNLYGNYAMQKAMSVMQVKHLSDAQLSELFHHKGEKVSKFLLFIIIPIMALFSWLLGFKKRSLYFDHFIFCIEESSFFILWAFLLLPLLMLFLTFAGLPYIFFADSINMVWIILVFITHLFFAAKRFFQFKWYYNIFFSLVFTFALGIVIQYLYKFILFVITINQI